MKVTKYLCAQKTFAECETRIASSRDKRLHYWPAIVKNATFHKLKRIEPMTSWLLEKYKCEIVQTKWEKYVIYVITIAVHTHTFYLAHLFFNRSCWGSVLQCTQKIIFFPAFWLWNAIVHLLLTMKTNSNYFRKWRKVISQNSKTWRKRQQEIIFAM